MNNQHHTCILEADYYISVYKVHFKLAWEGTRNEKRHIKAIMPEKRNRFSRKDSVYVGDETKLINP